MQRSEARSPDQGLTGPPSGPQGPQRASQGLQKGIVGPPGPVKCIPLAPRSLIGPPRGLHRMRCSTTLPLRGVRTGKLASGGEGGPTYGTCIRGTAKGNHSMRRPANQRGGWVAGVGGCGGEGVGSARRLGVKRMGCHTRQGTVKAGRSGAIHGPSGDLRPPVSQC